MNQFQKEGFFKKNIVWVVVVVALAVFAYLMVNGWDKVVNEKVDKMTTITGNFNCLPFKKNIEISETGCVLGIKDREGKFFALDISRIQDANTDLKVDDTIAVTGVLRPENEVPGTEWEIFEVSGIVKVNTLLRTR